MADEKLDDLQRRVADDRAALSRSLDMMGVTLAPARLAAEARSFGGQIGEELWSATRENPAAFALLGAGLALMLSGAGRRDDTDAAPREPALASGDPAMQATPRSHPTSAARLRRRLGHGLDNLPGGARARVLQARRQALAAQEAIEDRAARLGRRAGDMARDQPVAVSAAAFGLGALAAALLPPTRREDDWMGAERDALMEEARAVLRRELDALHAATEGRHPPEPGSHAAAPGLHVPS